jgi:DNA-binding PadR family transcriptional regulator
VLITKPSWKLAGDRITQHVSVLACCLGLEESNISPGRVSYELRRLRLHGLIERIEGTHRYRLTPEGLGTVVFYQRTYARIIRPGLSVIPSTSCRQDLPIVRAFHKLQSEIDALVEANRWPL